VTPGLRPADALARPFPLCALPTPLMGAPRLARALGLRSLHVVKRDDLTGFAVAGNKARKLEFLLGDALGRGCDVLLTGGGPGSNFCAAAAAAARVGHLACELVLYGLDPGPPPGGPVNLALARAWGARIRFTGDPDRSSVDRDLAAVGSELRAAGRRVYAMPRGGATSLGALGYAEAAGELAVQIDEARLRDPVVVVATGSGGTQAGLLAGCAAGGWGFRVVGASVSRQAEESRARVWSLAAECAALLGSPAPDPGLVEIVDVRGPGYGIASEAGNRAARVAAETEGLLLEHVFTAKAMGLVGSLVTSTDYDEGSDVVFVHTGGIATSLAAIAAGEWADGEGNRGGA
jgi:D-cysteine desulfhydrase